MPSSVILVSAVLVLSRRQTDRQTDRITDTTQHLTHATVVGVSNKVIYVLSAALVLKEYRIAFHHIIIIHCVFCMFSTQSSSVNLAQID